MSYAGSCHCGALAFEVDGAIPGEAVSCNCSYCRRKGLLLTFVPAGQFHLTAGEDATTEYRFNAHRIEHRFCGTCGTQAFSYGAMPDGTRMVAINLRCVPAADLDALTLQRFDGASA